MEPTKTEIEMLKAFMLGKMIFEVAAENQVRAGPVILSCKALVKHIYQTLNGKEVITPLGPHTVALSKEDVAFCLNLKQDLKTGSFFFRKQNNDEISEPSLDLFTGCRDFGIMLDSCKTSLSDFVKFFERTNRPRMAFMDQVKSQGRVVSKETTSKIPTLPAQYRSA